MDGSREHYAKWSELDTTRQKLYDFTPTWNTQKVTNDITKQTKPNGYLDTNKGVVVTRGEGSGGRANWVEGVKYMEMKEN